MQETLIKVGSAVALLAFYIPFLVIMTRSVGAKSGRRHFYRSLKNIFEREKDNSKAIDQISIIYRQVSENNTEFSKKYRTPIDICEDLLSRATGFTSFVFKLHYSLSFTPEEISRLADIVKSIETEMPFISLSPKYGNQLEMLKLAYTSNDVDLGSNGLKQLAKDIKFLESTIENQERKNRTSTWVSVIGVILTIVFGAVSIFQVYASSPNL
ncbi:hypothetical protein [Marinicellulosiphila megalodicopiae]|uniref:hypothetical protein n=1 Tax=Marinicellulosiphila megalodicopiae TaxID=2724896 RepID=UPI003BB10A44